MTKKLSPDERKARETARAQYIKDNKRWYIRYQFKRRTPKGPAHSWKSWWDIAVVPILFKSEKEASNYLVDIGFRNMPLDRKMSASVEVKWLKPQLGRQKESTSG